MSEASVVVEVPRYSDITRRVLQCKDHIFALANGTCNCLPRSLNLEQTDIGATS